MNKNTKENEYLDKININLDNQEFIEQNMPLLREMEERDYDLRKQHNSSFLTFTGFLIATAGVIISVNDVNQGTKYVLISSVLCFVLGYFFCFSHSELGINKFSKSISLLLNWSNIKYKEEINKAMNDINNIRKESKKEKILKILYIIFQNLGILSFIAGLIMFIISLKIK